MNHEAASPRGRGRPTGRAAKCRAPAGLCAALLFWSGLVHAWESDVHYGLTRWLALQAGLKPEYAEAIAFADENLDRTAASAVHLVITYACLRRDEQMSNLVKEHHFPTFGPVPGDPGKRKVEKDSKAANRKVNNELATGVDQSVEQERRESLRRLGEALHAFQDSWSHQGLPDTPGGLLGFVCDEKLAWGHPKARGGYRETWADQTYRWEDDSIRTAARTYEALLAYRKANAWAAGQAPRPWPRIERDVEAFGAARFKDDKSEWFRKRGFEDVSFLRHSSLEYRSPDFPDSAIYARADEVMPVSAQVMKDAGAPQEVAEGFTRFFESWLVKNEEFGSMLMPAQMAKGMGLDVFRKEDDRALAVIEELSLFRLKNFGAATRQMAEMRTAREASPGAARRLASRSGGRVEYGSVRDAFQPLGEDRLPFIVVRAPLLVPSLGGQGKGNAYAAIGKLRHTANTAIVVVGTPTVEGLKVIGFERYTTH